MLIRSVRLGSAGPDLLLQDLDNMTNSSQAGNPDNLIRVTGVWANWYLKVARKIRQGQLGADLLSPWNKMHSDNGFQLTRQQSCLAGKSSTNPLRHHKKTFESSPQTHNPPPPPRSAWEECHAWRECY